MRGASFGKLFWFKSKNNLRIINYFINIIFNFLLFYIVFKFGDINFKFVFNNIDLILTVLPLFFTLGIERVFIYSNGAARNLDIIVELITLITLVTLFFLAVTLVFSQEAFVAVLLTYVYAFSNISNSQSQISKNLNVLFFSVHLIKLFIIIIFILMLKFQYINLNIDTFKNLFILISFILFIFTIKFLLRFLSFKNILKLLGQSKYILFMSILGLIYSGLPRIYEIFLGSPYLSVKFFFWMKLVGYVGVLGVAFNFWITKYIIKNEISYRTLKIMNAGLIVSTACLYFINLLNWFSPFQVIVDNRIEQFYVFIFSLVLLLSIIRDLYIENSLSVSLKFYERYFSFFLTCIVTIILSLAAFAMDLLSTLTILLIFLLSAFLWNLIGMAYLKVNQRANLAQSWMILFVFCIASAPLLFFNYN